MTNGDAGEIEVSITTEVAALPVDKLLQSLIKLANGGRFWAQVTLWIKGTIVSGDLISFTEYMDALTGSIRDPANLVTTPIRSPPEPGDDEPAQRFMEEVASEVDALRANIEKSGEGLDNPRLIHLKNVSIFDTATKQQIPIESPTLMVWRGRLESVDGYMIGHISIQTPRGPEVVKL